MNTTKVEKLFPDSISIDINVCDTPLCIYPDDACSCVSKKSTMDFQTRSKHCIKVYSLCLYPIIVAADNKIKTGNVRFEANGSTDLVDHDHLWTFSDIIRSSTLENSVEIIPVGYGHETVETSYTLMTPHNGKDKSGKILIDFHITR